MTYENILFEKKNAIGYVTVNRPKALNALTYPMVGQITLALTEWEHDAAIELVILDGAGDRALCVGGDVLSLMRAASKARAMRENSGRTSIA